MNVRLTVLFTASSRYLDMFRSQFVWIYEICRAHQIIAQSRIRRRVSVFDSLPTEKRRKSKRNVPSVD